MCESEGGKPDGAVNATPGNSRAPGPPAPFGECGR